MATTEISYVDSSGMNIAVTIERVSDGYRFRPSSNAFVAANTVTYSQKKIPLTEGTNEDTGSYTATISNLSGLSGTTDPGLCRIRFHDDDDANHVTIALVEGYIVGGALVRVDAFAGTLATPADLRVVMDEMLTSEVDGTRLTALTEAPPASPTFAQVAMLLYMLARNQRRDDGTVMRLYNDDGRAVMETAVTESDTATVRGTLTTSA